jgi:hypothetical protein
LVVERSMSRDWLSNTYVVAAEPMRDRPPPCNALDLAGDPYSGTGTV